MIKDIEVPFLTRLDEPSSFLVRPGYREKYASTKVSSEILKELEDFEGKPNKSYMLVVAVSPTEYWGANKNHDGFRESELIRKHHTFVENGTFFKNHVNKDPSKNYGDNVKSWYDPQMKRVIVLVSVDNYKAPDIVQDLENGKRLSVSMGCRIPFDVCSICGNKAPTRADYCDHMKYQAGEILPDGRKIFVDNPDPTFFDLSKVVRPAGHIEYIIKRVVPKKIQDQIELNSSVKRGSLRDVNMILEKAASMDDLSKLNDRERDFVNKIAQIKKVSIITKVINGDVVSPEDMDPRLQEVIRNSSKIINAKKEEHSSNDDIDDDTLDNLSSFPFKNIMSTMGVMGMHFRTPEITKLIVIKIKKKDPETTDLLNKVNATKEDMVDVLKKGPVDSVLDRPDVFKLVHDQGLTHPAMDEVLPDIIDLLSKLFMKRSTFPAVVEKRVISDDREAPIVKKAYTHYGSALAPHYLSDSQGNQYITTQEAMNRSSDAATASNLLFKAPLLAGALGLSTYVAHKFPIIGGKFLYPAAWAGTLLGAKKLNDWWEQPKMMVNPDITMQKMGSLLRKNDVEGLNKYASDWQTFSYGALDNMPQMPEQIEGVPYTIPNMHRNWYDTANKVIEGGAQFASKHPEAALVLGLVGTGVTLKGLSGVNNLLTRGVRQLGAISDKITK